jgi:hypothetical protein
MPLWHVAIEQSLHGTPERSYGLRPGERISLTASASSAAAINATIAAAIMVRGRLSATRCTLRRLR